MSDSIGVFIEGDLKLDLKFEQFPQNVHAALRQRIDGLTEELYARVEAAVPKKTGKLAAGIRESVRDSEERITGIVAVSADFAKAGALEYGAHRETSVKAHEMRLGHLWGRAMATPLIVDVPAHSRTPDIAERNFLRGPLAGMSGEAEAQLRAAVDEVAAQDS